MTDVSPDKVQTITLDDTDPAFTYSAGWSSDIANGQARFNDTATSTITARSAVEFRFTGQSVQVFGSLNVDHGSYAVSFVHHVA